MNLPTQNRSRGAMFAAVVFGLSIVFVLPYYVPVHDGISYSYLFGFNNRAAIALLVAFFAIFAIWTQGLGLSLPDSSSSDRRLFRFTGYAAIACSVLGAALLWAYAAMIFPLAEATYFLDRHDLYRMGEKLYQDFGFYYGPIMFYLPVWAGWVLPISPGNSQYLVWVCEWGLGTWVLWKTVQLASRGTKHGRTVFLLVWGFFMLGALVSSGSNYTPLRFCPILLIAVTVQQLYERGRSITLTFGVAAAGAVVMLFYSPEQGITFAAATLLFFIVCVRTRRPYTLTGLVAFVFVFGVAVAIANLMGVMDSIRAIGGGTLNFPLLAGPQTVGLILLLVVAGCSVAASFRTRSSNHPLVYLICLSLVSLPAAFSRADGGHIVINTLGALIAALVVLSQYPTVWRWVSMGFMIIVLSMTYQVSLSGQILTAAFSKQYHSRVAEAVVTTSVKLVYGKKADAEFAFLRPRHALEPNPAWLSLEPHSNFYAPMGVPRRVYPYDGDPQIHSGRYVLPMATASLVSATIADMEAHPDWPLLLQGGGAVNCYENPEGVRSFLKKTLFVPYLPHPIHSLDKYIPLCDYINSHYKPGPYNSPVPYFYVWTRYGRPIDQKP